LREKELFLKDSQDTLKLKEKQSVLTFWISAEQNSGKVCSSRNRTLSNKVEVPQVRRYFAVVEIIWVLVSRTFPTSSEEVTAREALISDSESAVAFRWLVSRV